MELDIIHGSFWITNLHWPKHSFGNSVGLHTFASSSGTVDMPLPSSAATGLVSFALIVVRVRRWLPFFGLLPWDHR